MNLLDETLSRLKSCPLSPQKIEAKTGLNKRWIYDLSIGRYADPGVNKITLLNDFLKSLDADSAKTG